MPVEILHMEQYDNETDKKRGEVHLPPSVHAEGYVPRLQELQRLDHTSHSQPDPCQRGGGKKREKGRPPSDETQSAVPLTKSQAEGKPASRECRRYGKCQSEEK